MQDSWRVVARELSVVRDVLRVIGGELTEGELRGGGFEAVTGSEAVPVLVGGTGAVRDGTVRAGRRAPESSCGGCVATWVERKAAARAGRGPRLAVCLRFRLAGLPDVGWFELVTSSWAFAETVGGRASAWGGLVGEVAGVLRLEVVRFVTVSGIEVGYQRPVLEVGGGAGSCVRG